MKSFGICLGAGLLALMLPGRSLHAGHPEHATAAAAAEVVRAFAALSLKSIPPALLQDAQAVAIFPNVLKAGFVVGGRFGRGVILVRGPGGTWSNPVFLRLVGGGIGWQIGVQSTDLILVFKTKNGLNRILQGKGKITLGGDVGVAAGPVGRQAEAATDVQLKSEIYSYSRSRGLFAGVSLEGAGISVDGEANRAFYGLRGGEPGEVLALRAVPLPAAQLQVELARLCAACSPPRRGGPPPRLLVPVPVPPGPPPWPW